MSLIMRKAGSKKGRRAINATHFSAKIKISFIIIM
jgi:hypothetical protein